MHIVLYEPEIPQNTGNIARTAAVTGSTLHLVGKLGFTIDDRHLRRAGLDYWWAVDIKYWDDINELQKAYKTSEFYFISTKGSRKYTSVKYSQNDFLVFGNESAGLPQNVIASNYQKTLRIPMRKEFRSLNLSNSVALVLYEALRQQDFVGFE